ncbi:MAG: DUF87 domain-containing protein [Chloroflexota bacterium]|nr:MAG: DUF87 domain-containing protein [Chloroflexota bacterium]
MPIPTSGHHSEEIQPSEHPLRLIQGTGASGRSSWSALSVHVPIKAVEPEPMTALMEHLHGLGTPFILQIVISYDLVDVRICAAASYIAQVERAIRAAVPDWNVVPSVLTHPATGSLRLISSIGPSDRPDWAPIRDLADNNGPDVVATLLAAIEPRMPDEQLVISYAVHPAGAEKRAAAFRALTQPATTEGVWGFVSVLLDSGPRSPRFEPRLQRRLEERLLQPTFAMTGTVALVGSNRARLISRARSLTALFKARFDATFGGLLLSNWTWQTAANTGKQREPSPSLLLTAAELSGLWHPPSDPVLVPQFAFLRRPLIPLPTPMLRARGLLLGHHLQHGGQVPVCLPTADLQMGHLVILGRTGVGKSTLAHQILRQIVMLPEQPGIGITDPHGELIRDFVKCSIRPEHEAKTVLLELGDVSYAVGLPFFTATPGVSLEAHVQTMFSVVRLLFREQWSPTRMEDAVFAATATLCRMPGATLLDVALLFQDRVFRRRVLSQLGNGDHSDQASLEFWANYDALSESAQREIVRPILYRLRAFYRSRAVRNMVCQTRGVDFSEIMDRGGILLVDLSGPEIQAEADLLGELIIARLHLAALARLERPREQRRPFYLTVDESQRFKGASLPSMLAESRKLACPVMLLTQYSDAWGDTLIESVLGNAGTLLTFRCSPTDSRRLSASLKPFAPQDLEDLDRHEVIAKLQIAGKTMPAVDLRTMPIENTPDDAVLERVRERTRERYARPRSEVEAELDRLRLQHHAWQVVDVEEE